MIRFCTRSELTADLDRLMPPDEPMVAIIVTAREVRDRMADYHANDMEYAEPNERVPFTEPDPRIIATALERAANSMERRVEDSRIIESIVSSDCLSR